MAILTIEQLLEKFGPGETPRSDDYQDLIQTLSDDRNAVHFSTTEPSDPMASPIWFNTSNLTLSVYDSEWKAVGVLLDISSAQNGDILVYSSSSEAWENQSTLDGGTP
jgi:hypothetical protein